ESHRHAACVAAARLGARGRPASAGDRRLQALDAGTIGAARGRGRPFCAAIGTYQRRTRGRGPFMHRTFLLLALVAGIAAPGPAMGQCGKLFRPAAPPERGPEPAAGASAAAAISTPAAVSAAARPLWGAAAFAVSAAAAARGRTVAAAAAAPWRHRGPA